MISPEFNSAIKAGNLLRVRIMLKDSLIVDPTFAQFNEMFVYAEKRLPELLEPYDNDILENDSSKWDKDLMNMELVKIVNNFSQMRIDHLKSVIKIVLADKIRYAKTVKTQQPGQPKPHPSFGQKSEARAQALKQLTQSSKKIEKIIWTVRNNNTWSSSKINDMEKAAKEILEAIRNYKKNQ